MVVAITNPILLRLANALEVKIIGGSAESCGAGSGSIIAGLTAIAATGSTRNANDIAVFRAPIAYSGCTIDEVYSYLESNFTSGEYIVAGVYHDQDADDTANLIVQSSAVEGNGVSESKTFTLASQPTITTAAHGTHLFLALHFSAAATMEYSGSQPDGYKTKIITGISYTGTMPATLDVSSMNNYYGHRTNVTTP